MAATISPNDIIDQSRSTDRLQTGWWHAAYLLWALLQRDIKTRYRRSMLGPAWAIIQPLMYMVVFTLLRGVVEVDTNGIPYPIFSFAALVPWSFFVNAVTASAPSVVMNASIIKKVAVPREIFPLVAVLTGLFDLLVAGAVLLGMMVYYRVPVGLELFLLPILVLLTVLLAFGTGMIFATFGTFKRDLVMAAPFIMQFWLFVSPIIYPMSQVPARWHVLYQLNPMVGLIEGYRSVLLHTKALPVEALAWSWVGTFCVLSIAWPLFRWASQYFADVI